jgi:plasmid maintenance system antidote protein VapI
MARDLGDAVRDAITNTCYGRSITWLAEQIGRHRNTVDGYLNRGYRVPVETAAVIARALDGFAHEILDHVERIRSHPEVRAYEKGGR